MYQCCQILREISSVQAKIHQSTSIEGQDDDNPHSVGMGQYMLYGSKIENVYKLFSYQRDALVRMSQILVD